jgi:hypothetical protein
MGQERVFKNNLDAAGRRHGCIELKRNAKREDIKSSQRKMGRECDQRGEEGGLKRWKEFERRQVVIKEVERV